MWQPVLQTLQGFLHSRVQKIALRFGVDGEPCFLLSLYGGEKIHLGFLGQVFKTLSLSGNETWEKAKPAKNQNAFRHHLNKTEFVQMHADLGVLDLVFHHQDGKVRHLVLEPGKKNLCVLFQFFIIRDKHQ